MRMASLISETKILPSPIFPVRAAAMMACTAFFQQFVRNYGFDLDLGQKIDGIFPATIELGVALLTAVASCFQDGHALHPDS